MIVKIFLSPHSFFDKKDNISASVHECLRLKVHCFKTSGIRKCPKLYKMFNSRSCKLPSDRFCCLCGQFIFAKKGRPISEALKSGYLH
jgi:hypothetical protein